MRLRQVWGTYSGTVEPEGSVDSRRQLPDADDFPSLPAEFAVDPFIARHVLFAFAVTESSVGFRAGVALGATVPEPSLWEQTRKTTEGSPKGWHRLPGSKCHQTSVDQDGDVLLGQCEVGLSGQWKMLTPTSAYLTKGKPSQAARHKILLVDQYLQ
jgi:hypothetical protein